MSYKTILPRIADCRKVALCDITTFNPSKSKISHINKTLVSFLPMANVNELNVNAHILQTKQLGSVYKEYTYFRNNDILLAKISPVFKMEKLV
jgi:hypothetical protein